MNYQAANVFLVIMLQNYSSETNPSLSVSALSTIYCSYDSSMVSPSSFATLLRFLIEMKPVFQSSNRLKIFLIFYLVSLSETLAVISSKNYSKSICPEPSASKSDIIWQIVWFLDSKPRDVMAALSSTYMVVYLLDQLILLHRYRKGRKPL